MGTAFVVSPYRFPTPVTGRFGNYSSLGTVAFPMSEDRAYCAQFTLSESSVSLLSMGAYFTTVDGGVAGEHIKFFVASDLAGEPDSILYVSVETVITVVPAWMTRAISGTLTAGTYWLGVIGAGFAASSRIGQITSGAGQARMRNGFSYASPPSSWPGADASYTNIVDIYAEYSIP